MSDSIGRQTIDALLPPGPLYHPKPGGDLDNLLEALGERYDGVADFLSALAFVRDPSKTPVFTDLEREYGIQPNDAISDSIRVARLNRKVYQADKIGSVDDMQDALDNAGFSLQVHLNNPPVDPDILIGSGEYIVNTYLGVQNATNIIVCGSPFAVCGSSEACCGYAIYVVTPFVYPTPPATHRGMVYFIGGAATRGVSGELTSIAAANVDANRRADLVTTILNMRPIMAWCCLIVNYV